MQYDNKVDKEFDVAHEVTSTKNQPDNNRLNAQTSFQINPKQVAILFNFGIFN